MKLTAFISDHGFGHAARSSAVLKELLRRGCELQIVTSVPEWFFADKLSSAPKNWQMLKQRVDVGLHQVSGIESDYVKTIDDLSNHWNNLDSTINKILPEIYSFQPDLIFFDITAMAVAIAKKLNIPAIAMGNFSWDWIYHDLATSDCRFASKIIEKKTAESFAHFRDLHRQLYAQTDLLLELPYSGDFSAFECSKVQLPWVGSRTMPHRTETLTKLGIDPLKKIALYSFGGHELPDINVTAWQIPANWHLLVVGHKLAGTNKGVSCFANLDIHQRDITYANIIDAADIVITKPGYGIVSDCIFSNTPMLHVERGQFAEYPLLLQAIEESLSHAKIDYSDVANASFFEVAEEVIKIVKKGSITLNGAEVAAETICDFLHSNKDCTL